RRAGGGSEGSRLRSPRAVRRSRGLRSVLIPRRRRVRPGVLRLRRGCRSRDPLCRSRLEVPAGPDGGGNSCAFRNPGRGLVGKESTEGGGTRPTRGQGTPPT